VALKRLFVLILPLAGSLILPIAVPFLMKQAGIGAGVGLILVVSCLWFAIMLHFAEMPEHSSMHRSINPAKGEH
jgi:4-amino-4-deoxy-L-arabinose transferase-like glycosyltransferase